ncbi:MAG: DUF434 domain-containing protein [Methanosarcinales archaeon]|nr:DUF434 domain-containing protein [Methanosarcinales archaeon]
MSSNPSTETEHLMKPADDIRYLLSQGYPRKSATTFVGNHYRLDEHKRHILTRVVHGHNHNDKMKETAAGTHIVVDGYNVLITVETALSGGEVYLCDDGLVRDAMGVFSRYKTGEMTLPAIHAIMDVLKNEKPAKVTVILDAQMKYSGKLKDEFMSEFRGITAGKDNENKDLNWMNWVDCDIFTSKHADFDIKTLSKETKNAIAVTVATSDSAIINSAPRVIDIPARVCEKNRISLIRI